MVSQQNYVPGEKKDHRFLYELPNTNVCSTTDNPPKKVSLIEKILAKLEK